MQDTLLCLTSVICPFYCPQNEEKVKWANVFIFNCSWRSGFLSASPERLSYTTSAASLRPLDDSITISDGLTATLSGAGKDNVAMKYSPKPLLPRNMMHSLPDALSGQTGRKLSPPAICQDRGFRWAFGKDRKISGLAKKGDKRRLSWVFNHLAVEPSVRARFVCVEKGRARGSNYVPGKFSGNNVAQLGLNWRNWTFLLAVHSYTQPPLIENEGSIIRCFLWLLWQRLVSVNWLVSERDYHFKVSSNICNPA